MCGPQEARKLLSGRATGVLSAIGSLKKLCNHPKVRVGEERNGPALHPRPHRTQ